MSWHSAAALAGAGVLTVTSALYLRSVMRGDIRPHPFTWGVWAALGMVGLAGTLAAGAGFGALPVMVLTALSAAVFGVSLRRRGEAEPVPRPAPWLAAAGLLGWLILGAPLIAAGCVVLADMMGAIPTVRKTWSDPASEPAGLWAAEAVGLGLGLLAFGRYTPATLLYPAYLTAAALTVAACASRRR